VRVEWSDIAFKDVQAIRDFIANDAPYYASQFIDRLMSSVDKLEEFPEIGRRVPEVDDNNIRELIFHSYRIIYQVNIEEELVLIVTVVHGSRDIAGQEHKPWEVV